MVVVQCQAKLFQVVAALAAAGGFAGLLHGGQQQRDQDRDDRDHDEQFDQSEPATTGSGHELVHAISFGKRTRYDTGETHRRKHSKTTGSKPAD